MTPDPEEKDEDDDLLWLLRASIAQNDARKNALARQHGKNLQRRFDDPPAEPSAFGELGKWRTCTA